MVIEDNEEERLRSVALQNAQSILHARRRAEEALRKQSEWLRVTLASIGDAVISTDAEGRVTFMNGVAEAMTGWSQAEALGRPLPEVFNIINGQSRQPVDNPVEIVLREGKVIGLANRAVLIDRDGAELPIDDSAAPIRDDQGRVVGVVLVFHDITERERLLAQEQHAREIAEAASRAKDEFLATVSHELRTPLNAILGWARLLSSGRLDDETAARGLKAIEQNARAQAQLIEDLLDVSRIISGKFRLKARPLEVAPIIEAAIDSVRPTADAKGVRLEALLDPDAGPVSGDAGRLQQVAWNLLSNAVKFTPKGGRVQVRLVRINSHIELEVSDTGQGIAREFLPYVFDRFRQADGSTTRSLGGLGLGLAIVRHIVELHGGSVAVDSSGEDQGATFTIRLPLMVTHMKASGEERVHPRVDGEAGLHFHPSPTLEGVKVLIVDDQPDSLLLLSTLLTQSGAYIKTANSAEEGFAQVKEWRPDVIVSDIGMPVEDGYSFMKRARTWMREKGVWIPAVALTAYARAEDRMKALSSGFQIHVPKPVEPAELITVLVSLVERPTTPWRDRP
jgi:PAS domain S-box-containing protein